MLRGLGYDANCGTLILGYLIGYLATAIPIPAGIGVLEGGLVGTLVLYGAPPAQTAAAVLIYHAIAFWIPSLGGLGAYTALRRIPVHTERNRHAPHPRAHVARARHTYRQSSPARDRPPTLRPRAATSARNHRPQQR
jgi:Lysylphosphatidylglycerol synthase TM region